MKSILCIIDLTESSHSVLTLASRLAASHQAHLTILFPYRLIDQNHQGDAAQLRFLLEQQALNSFVAFKKNIPILDSISFEFKPEIGFVGYIVGSFLQRQKVDMIVIGHQQAQRINESNGFSLENLIRDLKTPVTIVPEQQKIEIP